MTGRKTKWLWGLVALLLLGGMAVAVGWWRWAGRPAGGTGTVRVTVPPGATPKAVAELLAARKLIRSAPAFTLRARQATGVSIQPGVYDLSPGETPARLLRRLVRGDIATTKVTFPEGFTVRQIAQRLARRGLADEATFLDLATQQGSTLQASFTLPANLEGYLFPDTYTIPVGADARAIAQQLVGNFDRRVARALAEPLRRRGRSLRDLVIIASLIEREARVPQDRARIAGVIYNRLERSMLLQIDATVQYARGEHKTRLLYRDLEIDSPYNTYQVAGLPPGPICSPGLLSLRAALSPEPSDFLYYVARADGSHVFGRTLAEHNVNIVQVRRGIKRS